MQPKYILHVGFPKTASTWLQHHLQNSRKINYIGKHAGQARWKNDEIKNVRASLQGGCKDEYSFEQVNNIINDMMDVNPDYPIVLSDEILAKPWKNYPMWSEEFAKRLFRYFPESKILLTVRKQSSTACSLYRKYVEGLGLESLDMLEWFESGAGSSDINFWDRWNLLKYYNSLNKFFHGNVTVLPYEMMKDDSFEYCQAIQQFFGILDIEISMEEKINKASFHNDYFQLFKFLLRPNHWQNIKKNIKIKPVYDNNLLETIDAHFMEDNRELSKLCGIDLSKYNYF